MALIGSRRGDLTVLSLEKVAGKEKYGYNIYYYRCHCDKCGKEVVLPSTNIRTYTDCGKHRKEKVVRKFPYKDTFVTIVYVMKKSKMSYGVVAKKLRDGVPVEQLLKKK